MKFSPVVQSCLTLCYPHRLQHARLPYPSPTTRACSKSCQSSWWCHPTISSSVVPFSSCLQSFPASGSFPMSQFFISGSKNTGASASVSVLPMNIQDWFPLELTGLISLQSKALSSIFSNTTVQKHKFFGTQLSLWYNSYIHTWLLRVGHEWATFTSHPYLTIGKTMTLILKLQVKILIYLLKYNCNI